MVSIMMVIIEHLEPCINKWLLKEYEFVSVIFRNRIAFTNVTREQDIELLKPLGQVYRVSATELFRDMNNIIVLDPSAEEKLYTSDLKYAKYVIIGGIMGDNPPKGRTRLFITSRLSRAKPRNLGRKQFTIAGAAYVLKQIELGKRIDDIKYIYGLKIKKRLTKDIELEIELPYAFPLDDQGNIVLPENYIDIILNYAPVYEGKLLTSYHDMCQYR